MFSKKLLFIFIIIMLLALGTVSAEGNSTQTLEKSPEVKSFDDIQSEIDLASENDTIELEGTYASQGKEIIINKSITITSKNGATLNGSEKSNIFNISNVNVTLNNLNIINSKSENTPAIYSLGNLSISNSNLTDNLVHITYTYYSFDAEYDPINYTVGAIYSANTLKITDCKFNNNKAIRDGYEHEYFEYYTFQWGGAIDAGNSLIIDNSRFTNSEIRSNGTMTISNSRFKNSLIMCNGNNAISDSLFYKSKSGAISFSQNLSLTNCNFTNNKETTIGSVNYGDERYLLTVCGCSFEENYCAIETNSEVSIVNSTFSKNKHCAIYCENLTLLNSKFDSNYGGIEGTIQSENMYLANCTFTGNEEYAFCTNGFASIDGQNYTNKTYIGNSLNPIMIAKLSVAEAFATTYKSGETLRIKAVYTETNHPWDRYIEITLIKGKKVYEYVDWVNSKGVWKFKASNLPVGTYKGTIDYGSDYNLPLKNITIKITKAKAVVKAPKVTNKYKKSAYFKVTVKNKVTKKAAGKAVLNLKIGKKTYKVKTNKKGIAKFNTKNLKVGTYKVKITSGDGNYKISAKSTIKIKR
ncbi:right-handed parallel beta-helix repeat-containing protein [Methanobrevibacter sp.]|uniref:right-handed parallel beta-helix repeat-containing protein n=1 Tax=Methanobrevibacter sp. TaxID=66852 RepID=UPI00388D25B9